MTVKDVDENLKRKFGENLVDSLAKQHKLEIVELLGNGSYSQVAKANDKENKRTVALKIIDTRAREDTKEYLVKFLPREKTLILKLDHPNVLKTYQVIENVPSCVVFVSEFCAHGDLLQKLKKSGPMDDAEAKSTFRQLIEALMYLESKEIVHRDMKCENVLLDEWDNVKLADFGFARVLRKGEQSNTFCGSRVYVAPEILGAKAYTGNVTDVWSSGVVLYAMVTCLMPFDETKSEWMLERMQQHELTFPESPTLSAPLKSLLNDMLHPSAANRPSFRKICDSDWLRNTKYVMKPPNAKKPTAKPSTPKSPDGEKKKSRSKEKATSRERS